MFDNSILIVAHPDDEILWFSSILEKVNKIIICYSRSKSNQQVTEGRKKSIQQLPFRNVIDLNIVESEVFSNLNWKEPVRTKYGINLLKRHKNKKHYYNNYKNIKKELSKLVKDADVIFTHNPWGEYGNEEHVQIYRIIRDLKKKFDYKIWYQNYCSNRSLELMLKYIKGYKNNYVTLETNTNLAEKIKIIYQKNNCWTWYEDWKWFKDEKFILDEPYHDDLDIGHFFSINFIKVPFVYNNHRIGYQRILNLIKRKWQS